MQLLPRLASYRGRWQNDRLEGALAEAIEHLRTVWTIRVFWRTSDSFWVALEFTWQ